MNNWLPLSQQRMYQIGSGAVYGLTDIGLARPTNEDNFLIDEALGLVIIGDGMGGHEGGEIASAEAILAIRDYVRISLAAAKAGDGIDPIARLAMHKGSMPKSQSQDAFWPDETTPEMLTLIEAVEFANQRVFVQNHAAAKADGCGMGTTLTGFWVGLDNKSVVVFHVGDSRLYRYRGRELAILTRDDTLYQQAIESGAILNLPPRNLLLQAVGPFATVKPDVRSHSVMHGDVLMLCTDGLHGSVPQAEMEAILAATTADNLDETCAQLIALAKEYDSSDNITVVLMKWTG